MFILSSKIIYYNANRDNKRFRILDSRQVCYETSLSLIVSKDNHTISLKEFFDCDKAQNNELSHQKKK